MVATAALVAVIAAAGLWWWLAQQPDFEPADPTKMALPLPNKASIAVLPFDNLSGDENQDYLGEGLTENIIASLSVVPGRPAGRRARPPNLATKPEGTFPTMQSGTKVLVFASQKGGSGKTTLSGHIAIQAEMAGNGPVAVIDTDPQRSLAQWRYAREDPSLVLKVSDVDNIADDIEELKGLGIKTIVVDTPPAATSAIGEVVRHADLVVIPTRPSPHDLRAVGATIDIVESHRRPMIFVLNSAAARAKITAEAAMALSQHGTVAPAIIHNRVDFAASMTDGRTVMEVSEGSKSAGEITALWDYIASRIERMDQLRAAAPEPAPVLAEPEPEPSAPEPAPTLARAEAEAEPRGPEAEDETPAPGPPMFGPQQLMEPAEAVPVPPTAPAELRREATPTAEQFFAQRRDIRTPTFFGPDRRRKDEGVPGVPERRAASFGKRTT